MKGFEDQIWFFQISHKILYSDVGIGQDHPSDDEVEEEHRVGRQRFSPVKKAFNKNKILLKWADIKTPEKSYG